MELMLGALFDTPPKTAARVREGSSQAIRCANFSLNVCTHASNYFTHKVIRCS